MDVKIGLAWTLLLLQGVVVICQSPPNLPPNFPRFISVPENATIDSVLITLIVLDSDSGDSITISIPSAGTRELVKLGPVSQNPSNNWTCDVILIAHLDRDIEPPQRQLFFTATDKSGLLLNIQLNMFISDVNDNPPTFVNLPYRTSITEDTPVNSTVYQVSAKDPDTSAGAVVTYNITAVNVDNKTFQLGLGGSILLSKPLDYETLTFYHYNVTATDNGNPPCPGDKCQCTGKNETCNPGPVDLFITIIDVQDTPPIFDKVPYTGTVQENEALGFSILQVIAVDGDRGVAEPNHIHYSITEGDSSPFVINETNGIISVNTTLDADSEDVRNKEGLYVFTVTATEVPPPGLSPTSNPMNSSSTQVSIKVIDVNDNPPRFTNDSYFASVQENTPKGVPITVTSDIEVIDIDQSSNSRFWVYLEKDGVVYNDFETLPKEYKVIQDKSTITIRVVNSTVLDYEKIKNITFKLIAKENNTDPNITSSSEALVTLIIEDVNDNSPSFPVQKTTFNVSEDAPVGHTITTVTANDADSGKFGEVVFGLEDDGDGAFNISEKGLIQLAKQVDREMQQFYTLTVVASDSPGSNEDQRRKTQRIQINVIDVNDNPPIWTQFIPQVNVPESTKVGMKVTDLRAVDKDEGINGQIEYSIAPGTNGSGLFNISKSGDLAEIYIQESLIDHVGYLIVQVVAEDMGTPRNNATIDLLMFVIDENQNRPVFVQPDQSTYNSTAGQYPQIETDEEQPVQSVLYQLYATDKDTGQNALVMYYLDPTTNRDYEYFIVDRLNGTLKSERRLDREVKDIYEIQVRAEDNGQPAPLSMTLIMRIKLKDINDNEPTYESFNMPQEMQVFEEMSNAYIGLLEPAIDKDLYPYNQTCYYLYGGDHLSGLHLDKKTRNLTIIEKVDRETTDALNIVTKASEDCSLPDDFFISVSKASHVPETSTPPSTPYNASDVSLLRVKLTVVDINDNPPQFKNHDLSASAIYDVDIGTEIMSLMDSITDKDTPANRKNKFKLLSITPPSGAGDSVDTTKEAFVVSFNGSITTNIRFRSDIIGYFLLQVLAYDDDGMNDTAKIKVSLISTLDRLLLVFVKLPNQVEEIKESFIKQLSNILNLDLEMDKIQSHTNPDGTRDPARTDAYIHGRYRDTGKVIPAADLRRLLDVSSSAMNLLFSSGVSEAKTLTEEKVTDDTAELKKVIAIAVAVLSVAVVALLVALVHIVKLYRRRLRAATTVAYASPKEKEALDHPGTNKYFSSENPLFGKDIKHVDHDEDTTSHNSLDVNAVDASIPSPTSPSAGHNEEQEMYMQITDNNEFLSSGSTKHGSNLDSVLQAYSNKAFTKDGDEEDASVINKRNERRLLSSLNGDGLVYEDEPDFYDEIYDSDVPSSTIFQGYLEHTEI